MEHKYVIMPKSIFSDDVFLSLSTEQQRIVFEYFVQNHWCGVTKVNFRHWGFRCGMTEQAFKSAFSAMVGHYSGVFFFDESTREFALLKYPSLLNKDVKIESRTMRAIESTLQDVESIPLLRAIIASNPTSITGPYDKRMRRILMEEINIKKALEAPIISEGEGPDMTPETAECVDNVGNDNIHNSLTINGSSSITYKGKGIRDKGKEKSRERDVETLSPSLDFSDPFKYKETATTLINHLKDNPGIIDGMKSQVPKFADSWAILIEDYLLNLQSAGNWYELQVPSDAGKFYAWRGKIIAGAVKWAKARVRMNENGETAAGPAKPLYKMLNQ